MSWVAVNKNGNEIISKNKPKRVLRRLNFWEDMIGGDDDYGYNSVMPLPRGSIKKLIGRDLTWKDKPVELIE